MKYVWPHIFKDCFTSMWVQSYYFICTRCLEFSEFNKFSEKKEVYVLPIEQILGISRDIVMSFYEFALANEFNPIIRISCVSKSNCSIGRKLFIMSIIGHLSLQLATTLTQRVFAPLSFQLRDARRAGRWRLFSFNFFSRQTLMT